MHDALEPLMLAQWKFTTQSIIMLILQQPAVTGTDMEGKTIENILLNLDMKMLFRNNGGGFYNHLFWEVMSPNGGGLPRRVTCSN
jgi:Fe-Mn family superoxide dismutase